MAVVLLTAANQLPVLMAHNHYFADVHIVFLEGILKQAVGTDQQAVITVLVGVFLASYDLRPINWRSTGWHRAAEENADTSNRSTKK